MTTKKGCGMTTVLWLKGGLRGFGTAARCDNGLEKNALKKWLKVVVKKPSLFEHRMAFETRATTARGFRLPKSFLAIFFTALIFFVTFLYQG